ncbi:LOW QUALITY PROTEIN: early endosome antigen 1-like [Phacochoerus africanus]|uniref:LOW QUALITY PROTEIN: early endosome antigen 1-like n=1 Tax=Phacochoerus africanus TaxID=41426 RepID=UPI001FD923CC|nr:LOW QUALITY PROTEIN: early endosome antigen 1-like [Phacochoerus africanus]
MNLKNGQEVVVTEKLAEIGIERKTKSGLKSSVNENDLEKALRQIGDKDQKTQNLEALLQESKENTSFLEREREDFMQKFRLVTQLKAQENLHDQVQEQKALLRAAQDCVLSLEASINELNSQLSERKEKVSQLDIQIKAKTELLLSAEAAKTAQRADLQNHLDTAQNALQDKQQELNKVTTQLAQVTTNFQDKQEHCSQVKSHLKEYKEKHLSLEQKTEELEGQIKKLEADSLEVKASKEQALQDVQQQRQLNTDLELRATELSKQLEMEKETVSSTKLDLQKKSEALENIKQVLTKQEEEKKILKQEIENLSQNAKMQQKELNNKIQAAATELHKVQMEKETLVTELSAAKEELSKVSDSLKNSKSEFEEESQKGKAAILDMEKTCKDLKHHLQVQIECTHKEQNELKKSLEKEEETSHQLKLERNSIQGQLMQAQNSLKQKEKEEQQLQGKINELKQLTEQKKKQIEALQGESKRKAEVLKLRMCLVEDRGTEMDWHGLGQKKTEFREKQLFF